jgi:hypothetical protein
MADRLVTTYDAKKVIITLGGVPIGGYADGSFVEITPTADSFAKKTGADGEVARSRSNDNTHRVTITLQQSSLSNEYLSKVKNADKLTNLGMLPLSITDLSGTTLFFWPQAWVVTDPSWTYAKENTERAWAFDTGQVAAQNEGGTLI